MMTPAAPDGDELFAVHFSPPVPVDVQPVNVTTTPPTNVALLIVPLVMLCSHLTSCPFPRSFSGPKPKPVNDPPMGWNSGSAKAADATTRLSAITATSIKPANRAIFMFACLPCQQFSRTRPSCTERQTQALAETHYTSS